MSNILNAPVSVRRTTVNAPVAFQRLAVSAPVTAARDAYQLACAELLANDTPYEDLPTRAEWLASLQGEPGPPGASGDIYKVVNLRSFDALGDNDHDDSDALQEAINSISSNPVLTDDGGILLIPHGTYKITKTIELRMGVTLVGLRGSHNGAARWPEIRWHGPAGIPMMVVPRNDESDRVRMPMSGVIFSWDTNASNRASHCVVFEPRVDLDGSNFHDLVFAGASSHGVVFERGILNGRFTCCRFDQNGGYGFYLSGGNSNFTLEDCTYDNRIEGGVGGGGFFCANLSNDEVFGVQNDGTLSVVFSRCHLEPNSAIAEGDALFKFMPDPAKSNPDQICATLINVSSNNLAEVLISPASDWQSLVLVNCTGLTVSGVPHEDNSKPVVSGGINHHLFSAIHPTSIARNNDWDDTFIAPTPQGAYRPAKFRSDMEVEGIYRWGYETTQILNVLPNSPEFDDYPHFVNKGQAFCDPAVVGGVEGPRKLWICYSAGMVGNLTGVTATGSSGGYDIVVSSLAKLSVGQRIMVGNDAPRQINNIYPESNTVHLNGTLNSDHPAPGSPVSFVPALFKEVWLSAKRSSYPTTGSHGTWEVGDVIWNSVGSPGQPAGWRCTVAGNPGTWVPLGGTHRVVDVRDFGAKGDNTADDSDAIQNAIYFLETSTLNPGEGGRVIFPFGSYKITKKIILPSGVELLGIRGSYAVPARWPEIRWHGPAGVTAMIEIPRETEGTRVRTPIACLAIGCQAQNLANATMHGISFKPRVDLDGSHFHDLQIFGTKSHGMVFERGILNATFTSCRWDGCGGYAFYLAGYGESNFSFQGCTCDNSFYNETVGGTQGGFFCANMSGDEEFGLSGIYANNGTLKVVFTDCMCEPNTDVAEGEGTFKFMPQPSNPNPAQICATFINVSTNHTQSTPPNTVVLVSPESDWQRFVFINCTHLTLMGVPGERLTKPLLPHYIVPNTEPPEEIKSTNQHLLTAVHPISVAHDNRNYVPSPSRSSYRNAKFHSDVEMNGGIYRWSYETMQMLGVLPNSPDFDDYPHYVNYGQAFWNPAQFGAADGPRKLWICYSEGMVGNLTGVTASSTQEALSMVLIDNIANMVKFTVGQQIIVGTGGTTEYPRYINKIDPVNGKLWLSTNLSYSHNGSPVSFSQALFKEVWLTVKRSTYPTLAAHGTWEVGDVIWNDNAAVGQPIGWQCTGAGSPGTWMALDFATAAHTHSSLQSGNAPAGHALTSNGAGGSQFSALTLASVGITVLTPSAYMALVVAGTVSATTLYLVTE